MNNQNDLTMLYYSEKQRIHNEYNQKIKEKELENRIKQQIEKDILNKINIMLDDAASEKINNIATEIEKIIK